MVCIDLDRLQSIQLGEYALQGNRNDSSLSLVMRSRNGIESNLKIDLPSLHSIKSNGWSFAYFYALTFSGMFR